MVIRAENRQGKDLGGHARRPGPGAAPLHHRPPSSWAAWASCTASSRSSPAAASGCTRTRATARPTSCSSGEGELNDNGTITTLRAGDVSFTDSGEQHAIVNKGTEPLVFIGLILNK